MNATRRKALAKKKETSAQGSKALMLRTAHGTRTAADVPARPEVYLKDMEKTLRRLGDRHGLWRVFTDFLEMTACALSNAVDPRFRGQREERYMQIIKPYTREEVNEFPKLLGMLVLAFEGVGFADFLGPLFNMLELQNRHAGQFFTPYPVALMMAKMTLHDAKDLVAKHGFITFSEPCVGAGVTVIAAAQALEEEGLNYQQVMHVTAQDIASYCAHMAYIQFTLLHIPAVVIVGNTLAMEEREHWFTFAHLVGGWESRLRHRREARDAVADVTLRVADQLPLFPLEA